MQAKSKINVLMVLPKFPYPVEGGLERQAFELSNELLRNHDVRVYVLSTRFNSSHKKFENTEGISITRLPWYDARWMRFALLPMHITKAIWNVRSVIDVVHIHQHSPFGLWAIAVSRILRLPVLVKLPNIGQFGIPGIKKGLFGRFALGVFKLSNAFVSISHESLIELLNVGVPRRQILCIPNGIVPSLLQQSRQKSQLRTTSSICRVIFVGRIAFEKRLDVLLRAWYSIADQVCDRAVLEIWGEGEMRIELEKWCLERSLDSIKWRGHVANVRRELLDVDIFVLPSSAEGNSNAILEAMDAGLPIIATPVGGTAMQIGQMGQNYLVEVGDSSNLAKQILLLINNTPDRINYGIALRQRVLNHFNLSYIAKGYVLAYQKLIASSDFDLEMCSHLPEK